MPKISIIVPIYKVERYLRQCVDSVLSQSYRNFELIIVDDGSPDACPQICVNEIACSYREGLPLNVMEAMLCGKPVAASNNRGYRELVKPGINGYLVEPDDLDGFAEKTANILNNSQDYSNITLSSVVKFACDNVTEELRCIYEC